MNEWTIIFCLVFLMIVAVSCSVGCLFQYGKVKKRWKELYRTNKHNKKLLILNKESSKRLQKRYEDMENKAHKLSIDNLELQQRVKDAHDKALEAQKSLLEMKDRLVTAITTNKDLCKSFEEYVEEKDKRNKG